MRDEEGMFPVKLMARLLEVHRSGYYAWRQQQADGRQSRPQLARRERLRELIWQVWDDSNKVYGVRRIRVALALQGEWVSAWLIAKLMRELGIAGIQPRASQRTTIPATDADTRQDLVRRRFHAPVPTTHLVGDITYLKTGEGWLYLATVIDLTTRMVVGWQTADHMRTSIVVDALKLAYRGGYVAGGAIFHSDRGSQYTSAELADVAELMDVRLSVGRTGVCWDNAVAESFFASLKNEMYHRAVFRTRARARLAVAEYVEVFYNRQRFHSTLGYQAPAAVMRNFFARNIPVAARTNMVSVA